MSFLLARNDLSTPDLVSNVRYTSPERVLQLLSRQLKDIQVQADKILKGEMSAENVLQFARYSAELKNYIRNNVTAPEILGRLNELPEINYRRNQVQWWHFILFPTWWLILYKDHVAKNRTIEEIREARNKYGMFEMMVNSAINS